MSNYRRIRTLFPCHLGLARGKYIPTRLAADGARFCISTFALTYDRDMFPTATSRLLEGLPDCDLAYNMDDIRPSWQPGTGVVLGDVTFHGEPIGAAPRTVLKKAIADWKALGYDVNLGIETEAWVLQPNDDGGWDEWDTPGAYVYGTGPAVDPIGLMDEIMEMAESIGLPVETINSEYDTPCFEMTLQYADALTAVDEIFLFKLMAKEIAFKRGLRLSFMGKPFSDRGGAGLHFNMSLVKDGQNMMEDTSKPDGVSDLAKQCIAGMIEKHEAMTLLCAPTVNSYRRLVPAQLAGFWANWGYDHRGVTVRIPHSRGKATRVEHRMACGSANPYLAAAAVLQTARLGVVNNYDLPAAEEQDCLESQSTDRHTPTTLLQACDALEADKELAEAMGTECVEQLTQVKRFEWEKFTDANPDWETAENVTTQWELDYYGPFI